MHVLDELTVRSGGRVNVTAASKELRVKILLISVVSYG